MTDGQHSGYRSTNYYSSPAHESLPSYRSASKTKYYHSKSLTKSAQSIRNKPKVTIEDQSTNLVYYKPIRNAQPIRNAPKETTKIKSKNGFYYKPIDSIPKSEFYYKPIDSPTGGYGLQQSSTESIYQKELPNYKFGLIAPSQSTTTSTPLTAATLIGIEANPDQSEESVEQGLMLLDDLITTISEASGSPADSDPKEVEAVKSIFPDIIDEVSRVIESKFEANSEGESQKDAFIIGSNATKNALNNASTQSAIVSILETYIKNLKDFISRGQQGNLM